MSKGEKPVLGVRVDGDLLKRVDALAASAGVGRAEIVERCLALGLSNQEELREWIEAPVKGPLNELLTHPHVLRAVYRLLGKEFEADPTSSAIRRKAGERRKKGPKPRPATE